MADLTMDKLVALCKNRGLIFAGSELYGGLANTWDYGPLFPGVPAFEELADSPLVQLAERLTGHSAESAAFATEAPYLKALGCQTIVLGPGDIACAHQPDEYLDLARIEPTVQLLRGLIDECCLRPAEPQPQGSADA